MGLKFAKLVTLVTTRKLAIGGNRFCGAPNSHAPQKIFLWRIVLHAPQKCGILWRTKSTCATERHISVAHVLHTTHKLHTHIYTHTRLKRVDMILISIRT